MNNIVRIAETSGSIIIDALDLKARRALLAGSHRHSYQKGETVFARGDKGAWALLIEEGIVEVSVMSLNGRKSVLNHMEKGDILGEIALLDRLDRSANAIAMTDVSGTVISRQAILEALKNDSNACFTIMETLCSRVRNASERFETLSLTSASARLARCLVRISKKWGRWNADGSIYIEQKFTQTDLGELAGIARENVNRHLQSWIHDQIIQFDKGEITLLKPDVITEFAEL